MRQLIAGNWKMHGLSASLAEIRTLERQLMDRPATAEILVAPPFTLIGRAVAEAKGAFAIGGQDCHIEPSGAFTGDISAEMLKDSGATFVILGHSERRKFHGESDKLVAAKALAARRAGLTAIICIGEKDKQRSAGNALSVCGTQLAGSIPDGAQGDNTVVAYEPVWAIGSGKTPTQAEVSEMHAHIRSCLTGRFGEAGQSIRILYGGSVKPGNAEDILALPEVGGTLVGGASLKASEFLQIIAAARNSG